MPLDTCVITPETYMSSLHILREASSGVIYRARRTHMTEQNQVENQGEATSPEKKKRKYAIAAKWG